jgi:hypothetical protein
MKFAPECRSWATQEAVNNTHYLEAPASLWIIESFLYSTFTVSHWS